MEPGFSLLNPGTSLNFDGVSMIQQGREEEEEASDDEKEKEKELQDLLTNAFDDLIDDDEYEASGISFHKSYSDPELSVNNNNNRNETWSARDNWLERRPSATGSIQIDDDEANKIDQLSEFRNVQQTVFNHLQSVHKEESQISEAHSEPAQNSHSEIASPDDRFASGDGATNFHGNGSSQTQSSNYGWQLENSHSDSHESVDYTTQNNSVALPVSQSSLVSQESETLILSIPQSSKGVSNHRSARDHYQAHQSEEEEYKVHYTHFHEDEAVDNGQNETHEELQKQYLNAGLDAVNTEYTKLLILYQARGRDLEEAQDELNKIKEDSAKEIRILKHQLALMKADSENMLSSLKDHRQAVAQFEEANNQLQGKVNALESQIKNMDNNKKELIKSLQIAESTVESLNHQVAELQKSETLSRSKVQHENIVRSLQKTHEEEIRILKLENSSLKVQLEEKDEEARKFKKKFEDALLQNEQIQLERAETINRLTHSLEESQRQCHDLLETDNVAESSHLRSQIQTAVAAKAVTDSLVTSLQEEIASLKQELEMYESAAKLGAITFSAPDDDSFEQLGIKKNHEVKTSVSDKSEKDEPATLINCLKRELERSISSNRSKRSKLYKLQAELRSNLREYELLRTASIKKEEEAKVVEKSLNELHLKLKDQELKSKEKIDELSRNHSSALLELKTLQQNLSEKEAENKKLTSTVYQLQEQISKILVDGNEERHKSLERCQKMYLQLHEDSVKKIRIELMSEHAAALKTVESQLQETLKELQKVKELYLNVCKEKNELEDQLATIQQRSEEELRKNINKKEIEWKKQLLKFEKEKEEHFKEATRKIETQKDAEWKAHLEIVHAEKEKHLIQKLMELSEKSEKDKTTALKELEDLKAKETETEINLLKSSLLKEKLESLNELEAKMRSQMNTILSKFKNDKAEEMKELEERLMKEKMAALANLEKRKDEEKARELEQLVIRKNKEKQEKLKQYKEKIAKEKNEFEISLKEEIMRQKQNEIRMIEETKNQELLDAIQEVQDKAKKEKQILLDLLEELKKKSSVDDLESLKQKEHEMQEAFKKLTSEKDRELQEQLKQLQNQKDAEKILTLIHLAKEKDKETNKQIKELEERFQTEKEELVNALEKANTELQKYKKLYNETVMKSNSEWLNLLEKDKDKSDELANLIAKLSEEKAAALAKLSEEKDKEKKQALKELEELKDKERTECLKVFEEQYDKDYFSVLREHNAYLTETLKSARKEFEKEKNTIQQQNSELLNALREKNLQLFNSIEKFEINKVASSEQINLEQKVLMLLAHIGKLEAEAKLYNAQIKELQTNLNIKSEQLEQGNQEHNHILKQSEVTEKLIKELENQIKEKDKLIHQRNLDFEVVLKDKEAKTNANLETLSKQIHDYQEELRKLKELLVQKEVKLETVVKELQEKSILLSDQKKDVAKKEVEIRKREEELQERIRSLESSISEKIAEIESERLRYKNELDYLNNELNKAIKEKENLINRIEKGNDEDHETLLKALQEQTLLKEKLLQQQKHYEQNEQFYESKLREMQNEYSCTVQDLQEKINELEKGKLNIRENNSKDSPSEYNFHIAKLKHQYSQELMSVKKQYAQELESLKSVIQSYQDTYRQTILSESRSSGNNDLQQHIKTVINKLQGDIVSYVESLNKRSAMRIQSEVAKERSRLLSKLREEIGGATEKGVSAISNESKQLKKDKKPKSFQNSAIGVQAQNVTSALYRTGSLELIKDFKVTGNESEKLKPVIRSHSNEMLNQVPVNNCDNILSTSLTHNQSNNSFNSHKPKKPNSFHLDLSDHASPVHTLRKDHTINDGSISTSFGNVLSHQKDRQRLSSTRISHHCQFSRHFTETPAVSLKKTPKHSKHISHQYVLSDSEQPPAGRQRHSKNQNQDSPENETVHNYRYISSREQPVGESATDSTHSTNNNLEENNKSLINQEQFFPPMTPFDLQSYPYGFQQYSNRMNYPYDFDPMTTMYGAQFMQSENPEALQKNLQFVFESNPSVLLASRQPRHFNPPPDKLSKTPYSLYPGFTTLGTVTTPAKNFTVLEADSDSSFTYGDNQGNSGGEDQDVQQTTENVCT